MNNIVIVNQGGMRYLFAAPLDVKLKKGDKVKCDTRRGVTDGTVWADSLFVDDETAELIGNLMGARFPLKSVVGKEVTAVEMFDKPHKFKAGDKAKVIDNTCSHGYPTGEILTLTECVTKNRRPAWYAAESDIWYVREDDLEPYAEPEPEQEPMKLYCVKEFLPGTWLTKGKIYKVTANDKVKMDDGYITGYDSEGLGDTPFDQYFVPLVKRPAKKDEWVYMVEDYYEFSKGTLAKCVQEHFDGVHLFENADGVKNYLREERYLVLDGYAPEPKYYNGEVVCVETNDCFTMGQVYKFVNGKVKDDDGDERLIDGSGVESLDKWNEEYGISHARFIEFKGKADK